MAMFRTFHTNRPFSLTVLLVAVGLLLCFAAYIVYYLILLDASFKWYAIPIEIVFFFLLYWTFIKVYLTQPGNTPTFWTVNYQYENRHLQRKYCLTCHNFKPQRSHHCSACGKCILHMDHHCPWINNCVGFYNRKFFILFLFYLIVNLLFVVPQQIYLLVQQCVPIFQHQASITVNTVIRLIFVLFDIAILILIPPFMAYHLGLVIKNQTTITELKRQRQKQRGKVVQDRNIYDIGLYNNFIQCFGKKTWQWFLPITGTLSCDGINWPKNEQFRDIDQRTNQRAQNRNNQFKTHL